MSKHSKHFNKVIKKIPAKNVKYFFHLNLVTENSSTIISVALMYMKVPVEIDMKIALTTELKSANDNPINIPHGVVRLNIPNKIALLSKGNSCFAKFIPRVKASAHLCKTIAFL